MTEPVDRQMMSDTQRRFIAAAESLGATSPGGARVGAELPGIPVLELVQLIDAGIVREGAEGSYYVYSRARSAQPLEPTPSSMTTAQQLVKPLIFVVVCLVLPILFLFFARSSGS